LADWIRRERFEEVMATISDLQDTLQAIFQEFQTMQDEGELDSLWQSGIIKSTSILNDCKYAYNSANAASEEWDNNQYRATSACINDCQRAIRVVMNHF
jgi:hypothetical protein